MIDLQDDRSLVKGLLSAARTCTCWMGLSRPFRSLLMLEDYIQRSRWCGRPPARRFGLDAINLLGICRGGAFSLCYAALNPDKVRNLITMVTPVDFHRRQHAVELEPRESLDVDLFVDTLGNVPAGPDERTVTWMLKPFRLNLQKYVGLIDIPDDRKAIEDFLRMEKWIFDSPDQAGEAFRQFLKQFYQGKRLREGGIDIGGARSTWGWSKCRCSTSTPSRDHLVPPSASRC